MKMKGHIIRKAFILVTMLALVLACVQSYGAMSMTPYLQAVTQNSVYVLVECNSTSTVTVEYGTTTAYGSTATTTSTATASTGAYIHKVQLTGLTPNTLYHYRASQGGTPTGDYTFTTSPAAGTGFRFAWLADFRDGTSTHDKIATLAKGYNPKFSLYGGDVCASSTYSSWKSQFFRTNELSLIASVPFFNTFGNHEVYNSVSKAFTQAPSSPSGTQDYYSFDYGDMHVLVLNNNVSYAVGSAQYNFAQSDLSASTKPWKVVICHYCTYASDSNGHGSDAGMQTMATNIFEKTGVNVVFSGHNHYYQHNLVNGIHYMVIGTVGAPFYTPTNASWTVKSSQSYCFGIADVTPTSFKLNVYNDSNTTLDTLSLAK